MLKKVRIQPAMINDPPMGVMEIVIILIQWLGSKNTFDKAIV